MLISDLLYSVEHLITVLPSLSKVKSVSQVHLFWMSSTFPSPNLTSALCYPRALGNDSLWIYGLINSTVNVQYITKYKFVGLILQDASVISQNTR